MADAAAGHGPRAAHRGRGRQRQDRPAAGRRRARRDHGLRAADRPRQPRSSRSSPSAWRASCWSRRWPRWTRRRDRLMAGPAQPAALAVAPERELDDGSPPDGFAMLHALHLVATGLAEDRPAAAVRGRRPLGRRLLPARAELPGGPSGRRAADAGRLLPARRARAPPRSSWTAPRGAGRPHADAHRRWGRDPWPRWCASACPAPDEDACRAAADGDRREPAVPDRSCCARWPTRATASAAAALDPAGGAALPGRPGGAPDRPRGRGAPALAAAMAVLGDGSSLAMAAELAGRVAGDRRPDRAPACAGSRSWTPRTRSSFVHPLVRSSVYDSMTTAERDAAPRRRRRAAGGARTPRRRSWRPTGPPCARRGPSRPRGPWRGPPPTRWPGARPTRRVRWYRRALEEEAPEPPRAELLAALGHPEVALLDPAALDHLRQALTPRPTPP